MDFPSLCWGSVTFAFLCLLSTSRRAASRASHSKGLVLKVFVGCRFAIRVSLSLPFATLQIARTPPSRQAQVGNVAPVNTVRPSVFNCQSFLPDASSFFLVVWFFLLKRAVFPAVF